MIPCGQQPGRQHCSMNNAARALLCQAIGNDMLSSTLERGDGEERAAVKSPKRSAAVSRHMHACTRTQGCLKAVIQLSTSPRGISRSLDSASSPLPGARVCSRAYVRLRAQNTGTRPAADFEALGQTKRSERVGVQHKEKDDWTERREGGGGREGVKEGRGGGRERGRQGMSEGGGSAHAEHALHHLRQ